MTTLNYKQTARWNPAPLPQKDLRLDLPVRDNAPAPPAKSVRDYLDCRLTQTLEQQYGERWERMQKYSKLTFRAVLSLYVFWSQWFAAAPPEDLMAEALEQINSDLRLDDPEVYEAIASCIELPIQDLERLLQAIGEQIGDECWSPNTTTVPND